MVTKLRLLGVACACAGLLAFAPTAEAKTLNFELDNHPDGNQAPPLYGLRLDFPNSSDENTFSFNTGGGSTVSASLDTTTGIMTITGTVEHVEQNGSTAGTGGVYDLNATIQMVGDFTEANVLDFGTNVQGNTLSMTLTHDGTSTDTFSGGTEDGITWDGFGGDPDFNFAGGHRGVTGLSGWGWLEPNDADGTFSHVDSQDWLFTATFVPLPGAAGLIGLGMLGLALRNGTRRARES